MTLRTLICSSIVGLALPFTLKAQLYCPPIAGNSNGGKIDVTLGGGPTLLYGDINHTKNMGYGVFLKGDYRIYKGFYAGLEAQVGKLKATGEKNPYSAEWDPREANNSYFAFILNATVYPYRFFVEERELERKGFFERNILNGFYVGLGVGSIFNNYKFNDKTRGQVDFYDSTDPDNPILVRQLHNGDINGPRDIRRRTLPNDEPEEYIVYRRTAKDVLLPILNVGLSVPLNKRTSFDGRYLSAVVQSQFNFARGENLDGYDPRLPGPTELDLGPRREGAKNDMYNFTSVGLKYTF